MLLVRGIFSQGFFNRLWKVLSIAGHYRKVYHYSIDCFDGFLPLRIGQLDGVRIGKIGHRVAWHAARGAHSRHRLLWLVWLVPFAAWLGVHLRRNEVFLLQLLRTPAKNNALDEPVVLRTPRLEVQNRPEPPMIHQVLVLL